MILLNIYYIGQSLVEGLANGHKYDSTLKPLKTLKGLIFVDCIRFVGEYEISYVIFAP